ncbi:MAG TPA: fatty acid desaturase, partial [Pseudomonadales bacterium]|nr:fatty acid desaturase [Pseudomonadales bacterium]
MSETTSNIKTRWDVIVILGGTAAAAITLVPAWGVLVGYTTGLWVWLGVLLAWNGLSITAGYHRLWSHKSYNAHPAVRLMFALGGALSLQNSIKEWCSNHRRHHRYVDNVDTDPYSARRGLFYAHVGWMLKDYPATEHDYSNIKDLERDPLVNFQYDYYWYLAFTLNVCLPLVIGAAFGDPIGGFLLLGVARLVIAHHTTFCINSLAHAWGRQPYSDANTSKDNGLIALLTYGEGYHNFHHTFQRDYRNGIRWYHFDPTKWLIKGLSMVNLTSSLVRMSPEHIEQRVVEMQKKRATEKIIHFGHVH